MHGSVFDILVIVLFLAFVLTVVTIFILMSPHDNPITAFFREVVPFLAGG